MAATYFHYVADSHSCLLCTFQRECQDGAPLTVYATTPILRDILATRLRAASLPFTEVQGMLVLSRLVTDEQMKEFAHKALSAQEMSDIRICRTRGGELMNAISFTKWLARTDTSWFDNALEHRLFTTHFQPIVDFADKRIHGHECLIRLFTERAYSGAEIMETAVERGRVHVFDSFSRQLSVQSAAKQHMAGTKIFINFMPSSIYDPEFCMRSTFAAMEGTNLKPTDIVFEVVESERILDPKHLKKICAYYRSHGFGFALDDVGTGSNSLQMVCDLQPDYIKIDKSLIWGLKNPMYRSTIAKIADLAQEFGVKVIAEGIEDINAAETCLASGIRYMQGYFFCKPSGHMVTCSADLINLAQSLGQFSDVPSTVRETPQTI